MADFLLRLYRADHLETELPLELESDYRAFTLAMIIAEACEDACDRFELLRDGAIIRDGRCDFERLAIRPEELTLGTQERVLKTEEIMLESEERIARSRQLLARTRLYKNVIEEERRGRSWK